MLSVKLVGAQEALHVLHKLRGAVETFGNLQTIQVSADAVYAFGIETGRHRGGRLARKAGGAFFMRDGYREVRSGIPRRLLRAVKTGAPAVDREWSQIASDIRLAAQKRTPVVSGQLRDSIRSAFQGL